MLKREKLLCKEEADEFSKKKKKQGTVEEWYIYVGVNCQVTKQRTWFIYFVNDTSILLAL